MIADVSRFREIDALDSGEFAVEMRERHRGGQELSGRAKFARTSRHSRGHGKAKLFNGAHLKRQNRRVAW